MAGPLNDPTAAPYPTWAEVEAAIYRLAAEDARPARDTIENARLLAGFAAGRHQTPSSIDLGYFPTICLSWSTPDLSIQIEICDDHYEFYRFFDGATEIQHVDAASDTFPDALKMILDTLIGLTSVVESGKA